MKKPNILFLHPLCYKPTLANFKDRFEMLSRHYEGHIILSTNNPAEYDGKNFGNFTCHALPQISNKIKRYTTQFLKTIRLGISLNKKNPFSHIHCYDPYVLGCIGIILKRFIKAKIIIEINGHIGAIALHRQKNLFVIFKKYVFCLCVRFTFHNADILKFLNKEQMNEWRQFITDQKTVIFHDFVATHVFAPSKNRHENYIFFIGYPFHLKGVDVLIKAFLKISDLFPDIRFKIVGHCPGKEKERQHYRDMAQGNPRVEILGPVFFNDAIPLFENCTFFVLPSRSEAMGRVLVEAMASGKAVIGSRVGGIPEIIEDGQNGFLFESENVDELAEKMRCLLADETLRQKMGENSQKIVAEKFSSGKYVERFKEMIESENGKR